MTSNGTFPMRRPPRSMPPNSADDGRPSTVRPRPPPDRRGGDSAILHAQALPRRAERSSSCCGPPRARRRSHGGCGRQGERTFFHDGWHPPQSVVWIATCRGRPATQRRAALTTSRFVPIACMRCSTRRSAPSLTATITITAATPARRPDTLCAAGGPRESATKEQAAREPPAAPRAGRHSTPPWGLPHSPRRPDGTNGSAVMAVLGTRIRSHAPRRHDRASQHNRPAGIGKPPGISRIAVLLSASRSKAVGEEGGSLMSPGDHVAVHHRRASWNMIGAL